MTRFIFLAPVAFFGAVAVLLYAGLHRGPPSALPSPLIGKPVPMFETQELDQEAQSFAYADLVQGKPIIVNFWASWCAPCHIEAPVLDDLAEREGVTLYGIVYKDEPGPARKFLNEVGNPFSRIANDPDGRIGIDWGVTGVPETFVIDSEGIIRARYAGPLTEEIVRDIILPAAGL